MKKLLFKLIAVVSLVAVTFGTLAGCALFEVNQERDMAQVAVTVDISEGKAEGVATDIRKREIIAGYLSYGYYYVQNYNYTSAKAYQLVLDNLVNNAVIIQQSKKELSGNFKSAVYTDDAKVLTVADVKALNEEKGEAFLSLIASDLDIAAYTAKKVGDDGYAAGLAAYVENAYNGDLARTDASFRFVCDADEVLQAVSDGIENLNSFIESFMDEEEHEHNHEEVTYTARTTPTMDEEEETIDTAACEKIINDDQTGLNAKITGDRLKAFKKGYSRLQELGLIEADENNDKYFEGKNEPTVLSALQIDYFKNSIRTALDSKVVDVYEKALRNAKVATNDELWSQYQELGKKQNSEYVGDTSSLETALGEVSDSKFVVYNSNLGYGYVSHLVVEYNDEQKSGIADKKAEKDVTKAEISEYIDSLATQIEVKDLRETWVKSGYGTYNAEEKSYTFSDKYVYNTSDKAWNLAKFDGSLDGVTAYTEENDDGELELRFRFETVTPNVIGYDAFKSIVDQALNVNLTLNEAVKIGGYEALNYTERQEVLNRFEDIKFAYSTDTGNFNKYLGYLYSPYTAKDTYVSEFVKACETAVGSGEGSVVMFMSESYGLHILICTAVEGGTGYYDLESGKEQFVNDLEVKGTVAYNFKQANVSLIESNYVSAQADRFIKEYTQKTDDKGNNPYIVYNEKAYKDLVTE